jgi:hypothetical protein
MGQSVEKWSSHLPARAVRDVGRVLHAVSWTFGVPGISHIRRSSTLLTLSVLSLVVRRRNGPHEQ